MSAEFENNNVENIKDVCDDDVKLQKDATAGELDELKVIIDTHFNSIKNLIRYTKEKDENILKLSKQLQFYRDGVDFTLKKHVALELIEYRESCRKGIRDFAEKVLTSQEALKYINYLQLDFEDMLGNLGIKYNEGGIFYNGKDIKAPIEEIVFREVPIMANIGLDVPEIVNVHSLMQYLKSCEECLSKMIQNNDVLDSVMGDYIGLASVYEQGLYQVILYPIVRAIVKTYKQLRERIESLDILDDNATAIYIKQVNFVVDELEHILELCGVDIDGYVSDFYDPKKQRIVKFIASKDVNLNGKVVCRYTDCYSMENRIIYLSKVDVYKGKL